MFFRKNFVDNTIEEARAGALNIGDVVYTPTSGLTKIERQVILGGWLGDGSCLHQHGAMRNRGFCCRHSLKQKDYVDYKASLFKIPHKTRSYQVDNSFSKEKYELTTCSYGDINNLYNLCYKNEQKYITKEWLEELNWLGFAIWYMDDGSLHTGCKNTSIHLHTEGFSEKEVDTIVNFYTEKGYKLYKTSYRGYFIINFSTESSELIYQKIRAYICPSMQYKLPERHRGYFNENIIKESQESETEIVLREGQIINIEQGLTAHNPYKSKKMYRYDIEVEDNHNYFCQGVLVHNSKICLWWDDNTWHLSTSGNIDAFDTKVNNYDITFGEIFERALGYSIQKLGEKLNKANTYIFELTSPESRVIIPYEDGVYALAAIENETGNEPYNLSRWLPNIRKIKYYLFENIKEIKDACSYIDKNHEGFVVKDKYNNRIKIKGDEYLKLIHSYNINISQKDLLRMIINKNIDDFIFYNENLCKINYIKEKLYNLIKTLDTLKDNISMYLKYSRKDYAGVVLKKYPAYKNFCFQLYDNPKLTVEEYISKTNINEIIRYLKLGDN